MVLSYPYVDYQFIISEQMQIKQILMNYIKFKIISFAFKINSLRICTTKAPAELIYIF